MKRIIISSLAIYALIAIVLFVSIKDSNKDISILAFSKNYSRLMTESETLAIPLYLSEDNSFLTEKTNITNLTICDDYNEIAATIKSIEQEDVKSQFQGKEYYTFIFEISFDWPNLANLQFELNDAKMNIFYMNGEEFNFSIGNLYLSFMDINQSNFLDLVNLSGIVNEIENEKYLVALNLRFMNLSNHEIKINQISTNTDKLKLDLGNLLEKQSTYEANVDFKEVIADYDHLGSADEAAYVLNDDFYLVIPLLYEGNFIKINRFPLFIEYEYNNEVQILIIDDFLFFNERINLDNYADEITEYLYIYP